MLTGIREISPKQYEQMLRHTIKNSGNLIIFGMAGGGKCLAPTTEVLKYDGSVVFAKDVVAGDLLMGPDSRPREVMSTTSGTGEMFKINPNKGDSWECNDVHVLTLVDTDTNEVIDIPLNEYLLKSPRWKIAKKLFQPDNGVEFSNGSSSVPIDPYFLGVWFGDGTKDLGDGVQVSKPDPEILGICEEMASRYNLRVSKYLYEDDRCPTYAIVGERFKSNALLNDMRKLLGEEVRIPRNYLSASREIRRSLLAGIIDTDGHLANGTHYEIAQRNHDLAKDIAFLARSLGFRVTESDKAVEGTVYKRLFILGDASMLPIRIPRKKPRTVPNTPGIKNPLRTGFSVESIGTGNYSGFTLDGDGRFLLGDFTVTHNTQMAQQVIEAMGYDAVYLNLSVLEAPDLVGVPRVDGDTMHYATPYYLPYMDKTSKPVVILIDEIDKAKAELQNPCLELMQFRAVNGKPLNVQAIVSTANMPDEGAFSLPLNHALANRCSVFQLQTSFQDWRDWAVNSKINPLVIGFLEKNVDLLQVRPNKDDPTAYCRPSPRSWVLAARDIDSLPQEASVDDQTLVMSGRIGVDAAVKFRVWMEHYRHIYPMVEKLVKTGKGPDKNMTIDRQLVFCIAACNEVSKATPVAGNYKPSKSEVTNAHMVAGNVFGWLGKLAPEIQIAGFRSTMTKPQISEYKLMNVKQVVDILEKIAKAIDYK
jgi:hypothetical protein